MVGGCGRLSWHWSYMEQSVSNVSIQLLDEIKHVLNAISTRWNHCLLCLKSQVVAKAGAAATAGASATKKTGYFDDSDWQLCPKEGGDGGGGGGSTWHRACTLGQDGKSMVEESNSTC